jgi:hypothetical protein
VDGDKPKDNATLSRAHATKVEIAFAVVVAVNHEGDRGRGRIQAKDRRSIIQRVTKAAHLKAEDEAEEILPREDEEEDEELEADISRLSNIVRKRHSSMVGAHCRRTIL